MKRQAVFLDRDGVLNEAVMIDGRPVPPRRAEDVIVPKGTAAMLERLRSLGFLLVVVTNQPDVARGSAMMSAVDEIHTALAQMLPIDAIYACAHDNSDKCACRKPRPGMLIDASRDHDIDLGASWLIGDRWVDVAAGVAAGVAPILLERPYSWLPTSAGNPPDGIRSCLRSTTLTGCVDLIVNAADS